MERHILKKIVVVVVLIVLSFIKCISSSPVNCKKHKDRLNDVNQLRKLFCPVVNNSNENIHFETKIGKDVAQYLVGLPSNITALHITIQRKDLKQFSKETHMDLTPLQKVSWIKRLWLTPKVSFGGRETLYFVSLHFEELHDEDTNITIMELHINTPLYLENSTVNLIRLLNKSPFLEILDLGGTYLLNHYPVLEDVTRVLANKPIRALSLKNIQSVTANNYARVFKTADILGPLDKFSLEYLDLSRNDYVRASDSLIEHIPCLRILDISYNHMINRSVDQLLLCNSGITQILLLHQNIEIVHMIGQGHGSNFRQGVPAEMCTVSFNLTNHGQASIVDRTQGSVTFSFLYKHYAKIRRFIPNECASLTDLMKTLKNDTKYCEVIQCVLEAKNLTFLRDISCHLFPNATQLIRYISKNNTDFHKLNDKIKTFLPRECLKRIDSLNPSKNRTNYCELVHCCTELNNLTVFRDVPCHLLPDLNQLTNYLSENCRNAIKYPLSRFLQELNMNYFFQIFMSNKWTTRGEDKSFCIVKNNLKYFSMSNSNDEYQQFLDKSTVLHPSANGIEGLDNLLMADISNNHLLINGSSSFVKSFKGIQSAFIGGNYLRYNVKLFKNHPYLKQVDFEGGGLNSSILLHNTFANSTDLEKINLSHNQLKNITLLFHNLPNLKLLNLSGNEISVLSSETILSLQERSGYGILEIDLSHNLLSCKCDDSSFESVKFIQTSSSNFNVTFTNYKSYVCNTQKTSMLLSNVVTEDLRKECFPSYVSVIVITSTVHFFAFVVLIISLMSWKYRYRIYTWYCHHLHFKKTAHHSKACKYDAFVSYCAEDRFWVHSKLMKILEQKYGFDLCIHYRDFLAGGHIADIIVENISESRCTIVVLSEISLTKEWCEYELKVAHHHCMKENKKLLILKLGNINSKVEGLVKYLLDSKTYIEWPESSISKSNMKKDIEDKFWAQLSKSVYDACAPSRSKPVCCCVYYKMTYRDVIEMTNTEVRAGSSKENEENVCSGPSKCCQENAAFSDETTDITLLPPVDPAIVCYARGTVGSDVVESNTVNDAINTHL